MLHYSILFLVVAIVAAILGFGGIVQTVAARNIPSVGSSDIESPF